jgi:hypothetical protein
MQALIYDQHLATTFEAFNCAGVGAGRNFLPMVAYGLFAELLDSYDLPSVAIQFATAYDSLKQRTVVNQTPQTQATTLAQMCFVMTHELVHERYRSAGIEAIIECLPPNDKDFVRSAADIYFSPSFESAVRPVMHDYPQLSEAVGRTLGLPIGAQPSYGESGSHIVGTLGALHIGEECFCDVIAVRLSQHFLAIEHQPEANAPVAGFLALHYLRLLAEIEMVIAQELGLNSDGAQYSHFVMNARIINFRRSFPLFGEESTCAMIDANQDYEASIGIPMLDLIGLLARLSESARIPIPTADHRGRRRRLEELLGIGGGPGYFFN